MEFSGARGLNFFLADPLAPRLAARRLDKKALDRLQAAGELIGGKLDALIEGCQREERLPKLERWDRWGDRIDEVRYDPDQLEARRLALGLNPLPPTSLVERMTLAYLLNQCGEGGVTCPLAMTDGLVGLLEARGAPEQKRRYLPLLKDPDGPTPLTGGQMVTEKQSGSNVSENETRARQAADGSWRLTGLKWFCSNPGELWVTSAKPEGKDHVALFLVPRRRPDGSLNECHILRLKAITGTRGKATVEIEYKDAYAELIGRPSHGLAILLQTVIRTSRIHVGAGSLGHARRAILEAELYARERRVMGRPLAELPQAAAALRAMRSQWAGGMLAYYEELDLLEKGDPAAEVLVPLMKLQGSRIGSWTVRQAQYLLAGQGIVRDFSILPRLADDAFIQEIWEGTHSVLAGHVVKALRRPRSRDPFFAIIRACESGASGTARAALEHHRKSLESFLSRDKDEEELSICDGAYAALKLALHSREASGPLNASGELGPESEALASPAY